MQQYIKKYFWVVGVAVVMLCSMFAAKAVNHYVEGEYLGESAEPAKQKRPNSKTSLSSRSICNFTRANTSSFKTIIRCRCTWISRKKLNGTPGVDTEGCRVEEIVKVS